VEIVASGRTIETSLGYFINPLICVLLGVLVLKERLRILQWAAMALGAIAVVVLNVAYGRLPWIALALSFAFYGFVKKSVGQRVDAITSLRIETAVPAASGLITVIPLLFFGAAALWLLLTVDMIRSARRGADYGQLAPCSNTPMTSGPAPRSPVELQLPGRQFRFFSLGMVAQVQQCQHQTAPDRNDRYQQHHNGDRAHYSVSFQLARGASSLGFSAADLALQGISESRNATAISATDIPQPNTPTNQVGISP